MAAPSEAGHEGALPSAALLEGAEPDSEVSAVGKNTKEQKRLRETETGVL